MIVVVSEACCADAVDYMKRGAADYLPVADLSGLAELARSILSRWTLNGSEAARWPGNLNLRLDGLNFPRLLSDCRTLAFSAGSACGSGTGAPSRVLSAIGLEPAQARNSIRLGFGRYTTREEVEAACTAIEAAARAQGV